MEVGNFNDSSSACAIDALSVISKRSFNKNLTFHHIDNNEVDYVYSILINGEASQSDIEDVTDLNILWCAIILILKSNPKLLNYRNDSIEPTELAVHIQRFLGAFFATFENLIDQQSHNISYLIQTLQNCFNENDSNLSENLLVQMISEYKSIFSYAYMFNRRTGRNPVSQIDKITEYFYKNKQKFLSSNNHNSHNNHLSTSKENELYNDSDNSFDNSFDNIGNFLPPLISAPTIMPLKPVKILSDDENYGSDYQPVVASDIDNDLYEKVNHTYNNNSNYNNNHDNNADENEVSILSSYYKYNGWNNIAEEDEDSDNNDGDRISSSYMMSPVTSNTTRTKRITRMRGGLNNKDVSSITKDNIVKDPKKTKNIKNNKTSTRSNNANNNSNHSKIVTKLDESIEELDLSTTLDDISSHSDIYVEDFNNSFDDNPPYVSKNKPLVNDTTSSSPVVIKTRWNTANTIIKEDNKNIQYENESSHHEDSNKPRIKLRNPLDASLDLNIINEKSINKSINPLEASIELNMRNNEKVSKSIIKSKNPLDESIEINKVKYDEKSNKPRIKFRNPLDASLELNRIDDIDDINNNNSSPDVDRIDYNNKYKSNNNNNNNNNDDDYSSNNNQNIIQTENILNLSVSDSDHSSPSDYEKSYRNISNNNNNNNNNNLSNKSLSDSKLPPLSLTINKQTPVVRLPSASSPSRIRIDSIDNNENDHVINTNTKQSQQPQPQKQSLKSYQGEDIKPTIPIISDISKSNNHILQDNTTIIQSQYDKKAIEHHAKILKIKESVSQREKEKLLQNLKLTEEFINKQKDENKQYDNNQELNQPFFQIINNTNIMNNNNNNIPSPGPEKILYSISKTNIELKLDKDPSIDIPNLHNSPLVRKNVSFTSTNPIPALENPIINDSISPMKDIVLSRHRTASNYDEVLYGSNCNSNNIKPTTTITTTTATDTTTNNNNSNNNNQETINTNNSSIKKNNVFDKQFLSLPANYSLPKLTEYALATGVIMEGFLQKKSSGIFGLWQKRYFVLSESEEYFCILRIYSNAISTAWGHVPIGLRASIPICAIESVEAITTNTTNGKVKDFKIKFTPRINNSTENNENLRSSIVRSNSITSNNSDNGSVYSEVMFGTKIKETILHADDAETRLLWMTFINKAIHIALNTEEYNML